MNSVAEAPLTRPPVDVPVFAIEGVSKWFVGSRHATEAIRDVSLQIGRTEFVSLVGPSGCGKTTLLNLMAGLTTADAGHVLFEDKVLVGPNTGVGYMTQDDALLPWRSVEGNVGLPLEIRGVPRSDRRLATREMISKVGLGAFERHFPMQLSGGMRKRVGMARTLVYRPRSLLLDEPFGALDAQTRVIMQRELLALVEDLGLTVVLVTHDLNEAIALSDRILVFSARPGRIIDEVTLPAGRKRDVLLRTRADDEVYARLWSRLGPEIMRTDLP